MLGGGAYSTTTQGIVENIDETPQIKYYNYAPNTIKVVGGSDTINFSYKPSNKVNYAQQSLNNNVSEQSTIHTQAGTSSINPKYVKNIDASAGQTIAYEYVFGNAMNRTAAVNLKSIGDTTGVTVSYLWRTSPLPQGEAVTNSPAKFTCQEMANKDDTIYLYVIVSSESSTIPADFTTDIVWYYGVPYDLTFTNNVTGTTDTVKLVKNQEIDETVLEIPEDYYFDTWFTDSNYTQIANLNDIKAGKPLYPRYHNIPTGVTTYMSYDSTTESYTVSEGCQNLVTSTNISIILPTIYDDGINGKALVVELGVDAFYNTGLTNITIPSSVTSIGNYAFYCCSFTSITIPSSVTSIGHYAFSQCESLTSIDLSSCTRLTSIESGAFDECIRLASITIPASISSIEDGAFRYCSSLTSITIPSSVTSIGSSAFDGCNSLQYNIYDNGKYLGNSTNPYIVLISSTNQSITSCTINASTKFIYSSAFDSCSSLTSITIPSSVTSIGRQAFYNCSSLTSITIPNSVTSIGRGVFLGCSSLTSITIPSSVTSIEIYAFSSCTKLTSITFEDPTTWYRTTTWSDWNNKQNGEETDVSNASTAATYLKSTYRDYYWYKL